MVKRIKKRIPKKEEPEQTIEPGEGEEAPQEDAGLRAELSTIADDGFTEKTAKFFQWLLDNRLPVLGTIGLLAVLLIGVAVYQRMEREAREAASASFSVAHKAYQEASAVEGKPGDEHAALLNKARDAFEATIKDHSDQPITAVAALGLAGAEMDLGNHKKAITFYDKALQADLDTFTRVIALQGKATAQEDSGDLAGAMLTWQTVGNVDSALYGLDAALQVGRLLEANKKTAEALTHYQKTLQDNAARFEGVAHRMIKHELEQRIARLGGAS
ncbi:tetratricopeptide repeat protein [Myxococcota bacterium]|nr:tetratricopeptide repeat protein [Myxococcota bacterium]MBU1429031.1 tetratricopeptide repeat protein [Myxococcota bacterium]MBU1899214.1 tetratricopeptide repeat protein [Myxococcota bacterium]